MTAALKFGVEELVDNLQSHLLRDETCGHGNNVAIVVLATQMGNLGTPAKGTTHIGVFVHGHLHTIAASADNDAATILAIVDNTAHLMSVIGVVDTLAGDKVDYLQNMVKNY